MFRSDTATTTSRSARHGHRHDAAFGGSNSSGARSNGTGSSKQSRRLHRSLPVTTSEVASCLSRKRKMMSAAAAAAEEEESPTMTAGGQNLLLPSAAAAANTSGRPRTAPVVAPFADRAGTNKPPAVNVVPATSTAQSLVPRTLTGTTTSECIGTSWGGAAMVGSMREPIFAGSLTVPARPTKKMIKRSRILAGGIVVGGGTSGGGSGGSAPYGFAFNDSGHATNTSASSYYLYHGHRHTNVARLSPASPRVYHDCCSTTSSRSSSSFDSFHDCLSCEEDEQNGNGHKYEVSFDVRFRVMYFFCVGSIHLTMHTHSNMSCTYFSNNPYPSRAFSTSTPPRRVASPPSVATASTTTPPSPSRFPSWKHTARIIARTSVGWTMNRANGPTSV